MSMIFVFLYGGVGACLRFGVSKLMAMTEFPFATLIVNVIGSFLIAYLAYSNGLESLKIQINSDHKMYLTAGLLGGFTTFSAFSLQTLELFNRAAFGLAFVNIFLNLFLCLFAAYLGTKI